MSDETDTETVDPISNAIAALRERASHQGPSVQADEEASKALGVHLAVNTERRNLRVLEALLFAANEPLDEETLIGRLPSEANIQALLAMLAEEQVEADIQEELLQNAGVYNVVLRRNEARQLMLEDAVRTVRLWACKGSPARLERELRKARATTSDPTPAD